MSYVKKLVQPAVSDYERSAIIIDTDEGHKSIAQLSTLNGPLVFNDSVLPALHEQAPPMVTLRFKLNPIPMAAKKVTGQLYVRGHHWQSANIYNEQDICFADRDLIPYCKWQGVDLIYLGTGNYSHNEHTQIIQGTTTPHFSLNCTVNECFYPYRFVLPEQSHYVQEQVPYGNGNFFIMVAPFVKGMNVLGFIPHSGYIHQLLDVRQICQSYAVITDAGQNKTFIALYTQHKMNKMAIALNTMTMVTNNQLAADPKYLTTISLNLGGFITKGHISLNLTTHDNNRHEYRSTAYIQTDVNSGEIDITFSKSTE